MKRAGSVAAACLALLALAAAQSRLPRLRGWRVASQPVLTAPGWQLPPPQAAVMAEFGLQTLRRATVRRGAAGVQLAAYRFGDSDGAYGAFTYLRHTRQRGDALSTSGRPLPGIEARSQPGQREGGASKRWPSHPGFHALALAPGVLAASSGGQIVLTRGRWVTILSAPQPRPLAAAARQLARALAPAAGAPLLLPTVAYQLPRAGFQPGSRRYAEGPLALAAACSWLPPALVGFDRSAETAVGAYAHGVAMAVISYPTPQIATAHFAALAALPGVYAHRSGSLIALVHGADAAAAAPLLNAVRYQANFTLVPPSPVGLDALPSLVLSIFLFCGLMFAVAVVLGVLTGGARVLLNRVLPRRFHRFQQENLIQLHLGGRLPGQLVSNRK